LRSVLTHACEQDTDGLAAERRRHRFKKHGSGRALRTNRIAVIDPNESTFGVQMMIRGRKVDGARCGD
jgi:hypothetical protein